MSDTKNVWLDNPKIWPSERAATADRRDDGLWAVPYIGSRFSEQIVLLPDGSTRIDDLYGNAVDVSGTVAAAYTWKD